MNEDPFLELLQGALEVPDDLTLGPSARSQLLAAAAAARDANEKIVSFPRASSVEQEAFDWLAGERTAGSALLGAIIASPGLQVSLEEDRRFLRSLRQALRHPVAASRTTARRRPASTFAAIAALLLISAIPAWKVIPHSGGGRLAAAPAPASPAPVLAVFHREDRRDLSSNPASSGRRSSDPGAAGATRPASAASQSLSGEANSLPPSWIAGAGCSIAATDPDWQASRPEMVSIPQGAEMPLAWDRVTDPAPESSALAANDSREKAAGYFPGMSTDLHLDNSLLFASRGDGEELSIPEPGGAAPVMVGFMILLMHRFRRRFPKEYHPIRP
ncbi:MAG: hypothetical protein JWO82_2527 [Akkermansiaceae bacterium]|nr:hypothetical protein [Akkermansiaceae bacterium]